MNKIKEIFNYRYMLETMLKHELFAKYKHSVLGILWVLINPLIQLLVYFVIFKYVFKVNIENYPIYLYIGIIGWHLFSTSITYGTESIVINSAIIKKIYFPREILPLSVILGCIANYIITFPIVIIGLILSGIGISKYILLLPIILIVQFTFTYSLTLICSALNVYIRDIKQIIKNLLFIWMYATPIVYAKEMVPESIMWLFNLNPMVHIINSYRSILYDKECFNVINLSIVFIISIILVILSEVLFNKLKNKFAEEL